MRSRSHHVNTPISIVGQSIVRFNQPAICYIAYRKGISVAINNGKGIIKIHGLSWLSKYLEKKIRRTLRALELRGVDVEVDGTGSLPTYDVVIAVLYEVLKAENISHQEAIGILSEALEIPRERVKLTLGVLGAKGVVAYREVEGTMELREDFPWLIGICGASPLKVSFIEERELEEPLNIVIHALGRSVITIARSIIEQDFEEFKKAITFYSEVIAALLKVPLKLLSVFRRISKLSSCACKIDEDMRSLMIFSLTEDGLRKGLNIAERMGLKTMAFGCFS